MKNCPVCDDAGSAEFGTKEGRKLRICEKCRHIRWEVFPTADDLAAYYREQYTLRHAQARIQDDARSYYSGHAAHLFQLAARPAAQVVIIDYGCSFPVFLEEAKKLGVRRAIGVDYSTQIPRDTGVEIVSPGDLKDIPQGIVDIVRFSHTLEHTVDPVCTLKQMTGMLRKGGLVYITQPNFPVMAIAGNEVELKDSVYPEHLHFFSPLSLAALAVRCGLRIHQIFSHQNEQGVLEKYEGRLDLDYSRKNMAPYAQHGDPAYAMGSYPQYAGENSVLYAYKDI
ncbi:MAG TPA: class I SAM-dependent methyltransferase [Bryobacteraceae bacterium]|nr:class I SAM-dependent methyltransferase [Bryobacteraceae bacterium]